MHQQAGALIRVVGAGRRTWRDFRVPSGINHGYPPPQQTLLPWPVGGLVAPLPNTPFTAGNSGENSIANPHRRTEYGENE